MRTLGDLTGSSLFPSWTADGRLYFRYDGDDYRGFMMASNVLSLPEQPLPSGGARVPATLRWEELFPETPPPAAETTLVMIWAAWSAHSPYALEHLQHASRTLRGRARQRERAHGDRTEQPTRRCRSSPARWRHHAPGDSGRAGPARPDRGPEPDSDDAAVPAWRPRRSAARRAVR